jgi:CHAD domain-containing protein
MTFARLGLPCQTYLVTMENPLHSYQEERFKRVLALAKKLDVLLDSETLHELRVELKRVRFIKNIIKELLGTESIDIVWKPLKKLFKELGEIRGQHVNIYRLNTTLGDSSKTSAYKHFNKKQVKLQERFHKNLNRKIVKLDILVATWHSLVLRLPAWNDAQFIHHLKKQIAKKINQKTATKDLHAARHLLKAVIYSTELSPAMSIEVGKVFDIPVAIKLEDAIGDWHDLTLLSDSKFNQLLKKKASKKIKLKKKAELKLVRQLIPNLFLPSKSNR